MSSLFLLANCTQATEPPGPSRGLDTPQTAVNAEAPKTSDPEALACLAEAIYFEARGTGREGQTAVAHVVVNRAEDPRFPRSVCGVVSDGCQFSYRCNGKSNTPSDPHAHAEAERIATNVLNGDAADLTSGALFFHSAGANPGWFKTRPRIGQIGGNIFYR